MFLIIQKEDNEEEKLIRETNEVVLERAGVKRTILNNIPRRKANWMGHILRINCLLQYAIQRQITEVKRVGKRTQLLDYLRSRRRYWELMEEAEHRNKWNRLKEEILI